MKSFNPDTLLTVCAALAILSLIQFQQPGGSFWTHATVQFFVPFWFLTISLNVLLTLLIVVRLLYVRRTILSVLGAEHARTYTSIITILVESSAIFSITGVIYIICFKTGSSVQTIVLGVLDQCVVGNYSGPERRRAESNFVQSALPRSSLSFESRKVVVGHAISAKKLYPHSECGRT